MYHIPHPKIRTAVFCLGILLPCLSFCQQKLKITGFIHDNAAQPLRDVMVTLYPDKHSVRTDNKGYFDIAGLYEGQYNLETSVPGYHSKKITIDLENKDTLLHINLTPMAHEIENISVQGKVTAVDNLIKAENAAMPVKVITRREIELMGSRRLDEVLKEQTGVAVVNDIAAGSRATGIQLQGFSSNYVMVLIDGQPMLGRNTGNFDLSRISVTNIERIEIIKGASSCLYGSDALGGAINIITRHGAVMPQAQASLLYGSLNIVDATVEAETPFASQRGSMVFSGNYYRTDGFNTNKKYMSDGTTTPPYENYSFQGRSRYRTSKNGTLGMTLRYAQRNSTMFNDWADQQVNEDKQTDKDLNLSASYDHNFSSGLRSMTRYYVNFYQNEMQARWVQQNALINAEKFDQQSHRLEQQFAYNPLTSLKLTGGVGGSIESMKNRGQEDTPNLNTAFGYVQGEWKAIDRLQATVGLRYDYTNAYYGRLSPSLGLQYQLSQSLTFKGGIGAGFKAPDHKMLYQTFYNPSANYMVVGADRVREVIEAMDQSGELSSKNKYMLDLAANNLKAEKSVSSNLGFVWAPNAKSRTEFTAFHHRIDNQINNIAVATGTRVGQIYTYRNLPKAVNKGFEVASSYQLTSDLEVSAGYQYLIAKDLSVADSIRAGKYPYNQMINNPATGESRPVSTKDYWGIEDRSRQMLNLKALYTYRPWDMNINIRANMRGKYPFQEINGNQFIDEYDAFVPDHVLLNLTIEKTIWKRQLTLRLIADNMLDYTHQYMPGQPGRVILGGISYRWIKGN